MGNPQGESGSYYFRKRPQRESTDPCGSRHHRGKCRLNTTSSANPPWASPGHLAFGHSDICFCFPALGDSLLPTTGSIKVSSCPIPGRGTGQTSAQLLSARAPKHPASLQMDSLTRNQLALGLGWLFAASRKCYCLAADSTAPSPSSFQAPEKSRCKVRSSTCPRASLQPGLLLGGLAPQRPRLLLLSKP